MRRQNRINKLPNEILRHILFFLTTKEAVATSVLSKRWKRLWISVPNFNFTKIRIDSIKSSYKFNEFVYSVLASRDAAGYNVDSFHLDIQYGTPEFAYHRSFPHVVRWINVVVRRNLKHLHIDHEIDEQDTYDDDRDAYLPKLPRSILTCRTLVSLKLRRFEVEGFLVSKIEFGFPSLKTLHFEDISFGNDRNFVLLLCGCPVLEDLELWKCYLTLSSRRDSDAIQMFQSLSLPKLTRAKIIESLWSHFPLKALSTVKSLSLDTLKLNTHDQTDDEGDEENQRQRTYIDIPIFHNLTHLKLHNSWDLVVQMLHHCPKLQSLKLSKDSVPNRSIGDDQENSVEEPELVPQCVSSSLRTCTVRNIGCQQSELMLPTFILKNARVLQTMKVWSGWNQRQSEVEEKLSPCPKASSTCQLFVY